MLLLNEACPVVLPNYLITDELSKTKLRELCLADDEMKYYIPDSTNVASIPRDFYLKVKYFLYL